VYDGDIQLITVGNFEDANKALDYYDAVINNAYIATQLPEAGKNVFAISVDNYPIFYREKNMEEYYKFFMREYLKKSLDKPGNAKEDGKK
jgi:hypothetical protein